MTPGFVRPVVLVVDDDRDTLDMYALFLEFSGIQVLTAATVDAAFALAIAHAPDVVITDLLVQGAATGADLCRQLHEDQRTANIPAILMTGSSRQADAQAAMAAGCAEVRIKPYLPDALVSDIRTILARSSARVAQ
ncbi:MAG: response regulator [Vicinamibacterales bacterium]